VSKINSNEKKVLLLGPLPEPIGGVSIHINRLMFYLKKIGYKILLCDESKINKKEIFNIRSLNFIQYLKLINQVELIHVHSSIHLFRLIHICTAFMLGKHIVVTLHSWRSFYLTTCIWRLLFQLTKVNLIYVNPDIKREILLDGIVSPAFVKPILDIEKPIPKDIEKWIEKKRVAGFTIVASNASRLSYHNNEDLYGLDICVDAITRLTRENISIAMIFIISDYKYNESYIKNIESIISKNGIDDRFLLYKGIVSFSQLLTKVDISIRATNTDGDSISVRESICLGCLVVASNCVDRPKQAIIFKNRSSESLAETLVSIKDKELKNYDFEDDCTRTIGHLYNSLLLV